MGGSLYSRELSLSLGMSKDYLCVYRTHNRHLKSYQEAYDEVIKRRQEDEKILFKIQAIFYELVEDKKISKFGRHLVSVGVHAQNNKIHTLLNASFPERRSLIPKDNFKQYETIIREFEEWKKWEQS